MNSLSKIFRTDIYSSESTKDRFARRGIVGAVVVMSGILLSGCNSLSGSGPYMGDIRASAENNSLPYSLIVLGPESLSPFTTAGRDSHKARYPVTKPSLQDLNLLPGDQIRIVIADSSIEGSLFAPMSTGGSIFDNVRLDSVGRISLPYIGIVDASGLTPFKLESELRRRAAKFASDPQARVELTSEFSRSVLVAGAVKSPGRLSVLNKSLTLLDAISLAGGPNIEPHLVTVIVRTGSRTQRINYQDVLSGDNFVLEPNAEVILERARKRFVAMGAVASPGLHDLPSSDSSLLEALGAVGGLNERAADPRGVFIFRAATSDDKDQPRAQVFQLDMRNPASIFIAKKFIILPEDAIYVTNAAVYEWQKIITPIVQTLILGQRVESF